MSTPSDLILEVDDLSVRFPVTGGVFLRRVGEVRAVDHVSFTIGRGETLGLVGESGCGKTTVGRAIVNILQAMAYGVEISGRILYHSENGIVDLARLGRKGMRPYRSDIQMVFQDPYASLNPRKTVNQIIAEPLKIHGVGGRLKPASTTDTGAPDPHRRVGGRLKPAPATDTGVSDPDRGVGGRLEPASTTGRGVPDPDRGVGSRLKPAPATDTGASDTDRGVEGRLEPAPATDTGASDTDRGVGSRLKPASAADTPSVVGSGFSRTSGSEIDNRVAWLLEKVGLSPEQGNRYPHEFSGGQRQRIGIARALATNPKLVIADEPVSALDVSVQAQVINLMQDLQEEFGLSYLFIAHDLSVVRHISNRIAVMYLGHIVEMGDAETIYQAPLHPYSRALLASAPRPDPNARRLRQARLAGDIPSPINKPSGCPFRTRCPIARESCADAMPPLEFREGRFVACPYSE